MIQDFWMTNTLTKKSEEQYWELPITTQRWKADTLDLSNLLWGFSPINLKQMDSVALLNRVDTKFIIPTGKLLNALPSLYSNYRILVIEGRRMSHYRTLYYDTPNFALYNLHVNGNSERYKVRSREYLDSNEAFLEVKHKNRKDRTIKERISTTEPVIQLDSHASLWLQGVLPYQSRDLEPKIWVMFTRMTLVNKQLCERVTIDVDLTFYAPFNIVQMDGIAIAEVKRDGVHCDSPFINLMHAQRYHPQGFSKYCIGTSLLYDTVKKNSLKQKLLWLEKISRGDRHE